MITLTDSAVSKLSTLITGSRKLRVLVKGTGCSGMAYTIEFADAIEDSDEVFEDQGVTVIIAPKSLLYLSGIELDFTREGLNEGFKFNNPNEKDRCGCGESFTV